MYKVKSIFLLFFVSLSGILLSQNKVNQFDEQGKRHGVWRGTHKESNRVRYEGEFNHGKEIGVFKYFDDTKACSIIATRDFSKGDGSCYAVFYDQKGNKVSEGKLIDKSPDGIWKYYHFESTQLMTIENYKFGKLHGAKKIFYKDGQLAEETNYSNGIKEGIAKTFSEKGDLIDEHMYLNGRFEGKATYYDGNGNKIYEGYYKDGNKIDKWKFFEKGNEIKEVKASKFAKELIKFEQRNTQKVSKTFQQLKKDQESGK